MKNINPLLRRFLNILSFAIILATAILEMCYPSVAFLRFGYLIGLTVTVASDSRRYAVWAVLLAVLLIITTYVYQGDHEAFKNVVFSRGYLGAGLCIIAFLVILAIQRKVKAEDYRTQMAGIFAYGTQGIILTNEDGEIVLVNPYTEKLFGYKSKELIGSKINSVLPESNNDGWMPDNIGGVEYGIRKDLVALHKNKSEFPVEVSVNKYQSSRKTSVVTFVNDITQRKITEEILKAKGDQLEVANRELEAFSYSVSHDLRSPLRAVGGYAQMLEEDYNAVLDDEGKRLLGNIRTSAQRMGVLIDDLLSFSRLGRKDIKKSSVNMNHVAQAAVADIHQGRKHDATVNIQPLHAAWADPSLILRVMVNLLSNAIKYSSKTVSPVVDISSTEDGGGVTYCVKDNGVGFDMKYAHKLFGVFQRLHSDEEFEGTGVGLAIVQRIVHKHGGKIWAEGKEGSGASFYFSLPLAPSEDSSVDSSVVSLPIQSQIY